MFHLTDYPPKGPKRLSRGTRPKKAALSGHPPPPVAAGARTPLEIAARNRIRALSGFQDPDALDPDALGSIAPCHKGMD